MRRKMIITNRSQITGEIHTMDMIVDALDIEAWREGALIQDVLGYLSADEREFLMTGITPAEWTKFLGDDE